MTEDGKTIIAVATPFGAGAIGIIRISGDGALSGVRPFFSGFKSEIQPGRMYYGNLKCGDYTDKCMCVYFAAPHSYTGEDTVEIYCHGSAALLYGVTAFLIDESGFVQAEGGDFTARAFKNGKLVSFVDGMVTDTPDLADEMYENAALHDENGAWQMIFGVNTIPECRKKGYAGQLIRCAIEQAKKEGRKGLVLTCKDKLLHYYENFGFVNEGVSKSVHGNVVWYQMRLTL